MADACLRNLHCSRCCCEQNWRGVVGAALCLRLFEAANNLAEGLPGTFSTPPVDNNILTYRRGVPRRSGTYSSRPILPPGLLEGLESGGEGWRSAAAVLVYACTHHTQVWDSDRPTLNFYSSCQALYALPREFTEETHTLNQSRGCMLLCSACQGAARARCRTRHSVSRTPSTSLMMPKYSCKADGGC